MKQKSRTEYSVMNTTIAFIAQVTAILMGFFTRVVFTRTLSEGYVGINGLFTDILNILSLSELGVGTAITYALYGPIARNDIKKQQILMRMFRTFYRMTAGFVLVAGLCLIPFLDIPMKDRPDVDHLVVIYILYLTNSVVSYLLIYKKTLVDAHQMNYITVIAGYLSDRCIASDRELYSVSYCCGCVYDKWKYLYVQKSGQTFSLLEGAL